MREYLNVIKENIAASPPLFASAIGIAGAVVFTRTLTDAVTAAAIAVIAMTASAAAAGAARRFTGGGALGALLFFAACAAMTAVCGLAASRIAPAAWERIAPYSPLFTAGGLAAHLSGTRRLGFVRAVVKSASTAVGYGVSLVIIAAVRAATGAMGIGFFDTVGGALVAAGVISAIYMSAVRAVRSAIVSRSHGSEAENGNE